MQDVLKLLIDERDKVSRAIAALGGAPRRGRPPKEQVAMPAVETIRKAATWTPERRFDHAKRMRRKWTPSQRAAQSRRARKMWQARRSA